MTGGQPSSGRCVWTSWLVRARWWPLVTCGRRTAAARGWCWCAHRPSILVWR
ncbi:hypothetical protein SAMN04487766_103229 [Actinomyces ruminicola]|uniref:Uncharacterized protein n=1 Tax=Actinomyces ruminicola TaxID=332524 RepID=A0A1G9U1I6_9ACTO|nr:hypothetical protein SAMN04487766_103229 [Actinomyces ruminicola]